MKELDVVELIKDFKDMPQGTKGTVVLEYDGTEFEVEFFDACGKTIDVLTAPKEYIKVVNSV